MKDMRIYTFDPAKNKMVMAGTLTGDTFIKKVKSSHYMQKEKGYGIQEDVLQELKKMKCRIVRIMLNCKPGTKQVKGITFCEGVIERPLTDWLNARIKNYGNGEQRFVNIDTKEQPVQLF